MARINGVQQARITSNSVFWPNSSNPPLLGHNGGSGNDSRYFDGDIAEVLVFDKVLTAAERATVQDYLVGRHQLAGEDETLAAPENLTAQVLGATQAGLKWDAEPSAWIAYEVQRKTGGGGYAGIATVGGLSCLDSTLEAGTGYTYRVRARSATAVSDWSNEATLATPAATGGATAIPVENLRLWLKADTLLTGILGSWADQSGNHNSAVAPSPANSPTVAQGEDGSLAVHFDAASSQKLGLPAFMSGATAGEAFIVLKAASAVPAAARGLWRMGYSTSSYYPNTNGTLNDDFGTSSNYGLGAPLADPAQWHVYNVSSKAGEWVARINGVQQARITSNSIFWPNSSNPPLLGHNGGSNNDSRYFDGDIAEVLVFDKTLTDPERRAVERYLSGKHRLNPAGFVQGEGDFSPLAPLVSLDGAAWQSSSYALEAAGDGGAVIWKKSGWVEYEFVLPKAGLCRMEIDFTQIDHELSAEVPYDLFLQIDGTGLGRFSGSVSSGEARLLRSYEHYLAAGAHRVRISAANLTASRVTRINRVHVLADESDQDEDGVPDGMTSPAVPAPVAHSTRISPYCLEDADSTALQVLLVSGTETLAAHPGAGYGAVSGWYARVPLSEEAGALVQATYTYARRTQNHVITWAPANLIAEAAPVHLRQDDRMKLSAWAGETPSGGVVELVITLPDGTAQTINTTSDAPQVYAFAQTGVYQIHAACGDGADGLLENDVQVVVIAPGLLEAGAEIIAGVGAQTWGVFPSGLDYAVSREVALSSTAAASGGVTLSLAAAQVGEYRILARAGESGENRVLASGEVRARRFLGTTDWGSFQIMHTLPDGDRVIRAEIYCGDLPEGYYIDVSIFSGSTLLADGTTSMRFYREDFDEDGVLRVYFTQAANAYGSICHNVKLYDADGALLKSW